MTTKQTYWIRDVEGNYALVDGAEARDEWTKVRGWALADEPRPLDQVHVTHENVEIRPGQLPYGALESWAGLGWSAGPPPEPVGAEAAPVAQAEPVAEPTKTTKAAVSGESKEK